MRKCCKQQQTKMHGKQQQKPMHKRFRKVWQEACIQRKVWRMDRVWLEEVPAHTRLLPAHTRLEQARLDHCHSRRVQTCRQ